MLLNDETFDKVKNLFKTPHNKIIACGVYYKNTVAFKLAYVDDNNIELSGFLAHITEDFKVHKVERLKLIWGRHKGQIITEYIPLHPAGNKSLLYKVHYNI